VIWLKILLISLMLVVLYSLASALFYLTKDKTGSKRMLKALTWRISISIGLFALLCIAYFMGWIYPHPVAPQPSKEAIHGIQRYKLQLTAYDIRSSHFDLRQ